MMPTSLKPEKIGDRVLLSIRLRSTAKWKWTTLKAGISVTRTSTRIQITDCELTVAETEDNSREYENRIEKSVQRSVTEKVLY